MVISSGTIEALKWLALLLMTLDHLNRYLLGQLLPALSRFGRLAMPLFGFVLAYNLARPGAFALGVHRRVMQRLAVAGLAATPVFFLLGHAANGWWPLNVMFMLLAATAIIFLIEKGGNVAPAACLAIFAFGGALVDFWWFGIAFCVCAWWYCKATSKGALLACVLAAFALSAANDASFWTLAAVPLMLAAPHFDVKLPRVRFAFYAYYPLHLAVLAAGAML